MINIVEVKTRRQLKQFIEFPNKLYKDNKYYCPSLYMDEYNHLNKKKNPMTDYIDFILYLAYVDDEIVGRVAGIINNQFNKEKHVLQARFNRIDFIDDFEVCKKLIQQVEKWALDNGMDEVIGPIGFTDLDKQGLLIDGYDQYDTFITLYHFPYYKEYIEKMGYKKDVDWFEYQLRTELVDQKQLDRIHRVAKRAADKNGFEVLRLKNRFKILKYGREMFNVYNEAFYELYGFLPIPKKVAKFYIWQVFFIINLKLCWFIRDKNKKMAGFGLMVPSMAKVTKKYNGRLNLFNFIAYLRAIHGKNDIVDFYFIAVKPEYQQLGLPSLMFTDGLLELEKRNVKVAETGPELELNDKIQNLWSNYNAKHHRTRRCYTKKLK